MLFLHGNKAGVIEGGKIASYMEYARNISQYQYIGKIAWRKDYYLWVFSNKQIPELHEVFENSYTANYKTDRQLTMEHIFSPPWTQWHE